MNDPIIGITAFAVLLILLTLRVPIGVAMLLCGIGGIVTLSGWNPILSQMKTAAFYHFSTFELSVVPLFFLMGQFAQRAGISTALFDACNTWFGRRRGGLAMASIGACAGFGAISGSSLATASTMAQIALPEMRKHNYSGSLATGSLAAGGTLGILIPPSIALVIYALLTEQNIATMFIAALVPGFLAAVGYIVAIDIYVRLYPNSAPLGLQTTLSLKFRSLAKIWPVIFIFLVVMGGIYIGFFTPTEAAAIGALCTGIMAWILGSMRWPGIRDSLLGTAETTAMIFLILFGADIFNSFLGRTMLPQELAIFLSDLNIAPMGVLIGMLLIYLVLGFVMDSLSMILLTIPIFFPVISALDFGLNPTETAIWFGILMLVVVEVGLITPPIGLNVIIINSMAKNISMSQTFQGVIPFFVSDMIRVLLLISFPALTLFLVRWVN